MSLKQWLLLALIAVIVCSAFVAAQDDDDESPEGSVVEGQTIEDVSEGVDAEGAAEEIEDMDAAEETDANGLRSVAWFPKFADMKVPAGQRVEILVPISNAASNPSYEVALVAGFLTMFDHQRYVQNFSAQVYDRVIEAGETATVKYSVTPDVMLDPMDYAFVVAAYLRTEDNQTVMVTAYNGTMTVTDPVGFDFKGWFTLLVFFGAIGGGAYYYVTKRQASAPRPARREPASPSAGATKSDTSYDPDFVDPSHLAYLKAKQQRNRSASK